jgi:hypothetical protein
MTDAVSSQAKMIYLARRNPALAPEDFAQAWREHSALGAGCSNVRDRVLSVSQCSRVLTLPGLAGAANDYDGVNLLLMRDLQSAADIWSDAQTLAIMRPDEPRVFSTYVKDFTLVCSGRVLRQAPAGPRPTHCVQAFLRRRSGFTAEQFQQRWSTDDKAWQDSPALDAALCINHNLVLGTPPPGFDFDAIAEWWFASESAAIAAFAAADLRERLPLALSDLADLQRSLFMFTHVTHSRP